MGWDDLCFSTKFYCRVLCTLVYCQMKSKVNASGNYTKPTMRKALFEKIKAGTKGGDPGEWSARKAQLLAVEYKKKGGGYK